MIRLKDFLIEQYSNKTINSAQLILQRIIDMADDGHLEYSDERITINIGRLIKNKQLNNLSLIIRKNSTPNIRMGIDNDENNVIVIDTKTLPKREKIDSFLAHARYFDRIVEKINEYLTKYHKENDSDEESSYEKRQNNNSRESFENNFAELKSKINDSVQEYKKSKKSLEREMNSTGAPSRKEMLTLAIKKLKDDILGATSKEFISKTLKDVDFVNHLDKEWKNKLISRLEDYYEHLGSI